MKGRTKDLLSVGMVTLGVVLLALTAFRRWDAPEPPTIEGVEQTPLAWSEIFSPQTFTFETSSSPPQRGGVLALFVLNAEVCSPCLFEVSEYTELLRTIELGGRNVESVALVFERDPQRARRFLETAALPLPGAWGYPEALAAKLGRYQDRTILQQLVFLDTQAETIFYRTLLPSVVTDLASKRAVLERVNSALGRGGPEVAAALPYTP